MVYLHKTKHICNRYWHGSYSKYSLTEEISIYGTGFPRFSKCLSNCDSPETVNFKKQYEEQTGVCKKNSKKKKRDSSVSINRPQDPIHSECEKFIWIVSCGYINDSTCNIPMEISHSPKHFGQHCPAGVWLRCWGHERTGHTSCTHRVLPP